MIARRESRHIAILVNVVKIALLAALAPPVISGIAAKANTLDAPMQTATVVALTMSAGSIGAILGALGFGRLSDTRTTSLRARWGWVTLGAGFGTLGLAVMCTTTSFGPFLAGWFGAQAGYSGAMAVLRAVLAHALPRHRRRGAVFIVVGAYGGLLIPLLLLVVVPGAVWETSIGLAALGLFIPLIVWIAPAKRYESDEGLAAVDGRFWSEGGSASHTEAGDDAPQHISTPVILFIQLTANAVAAAFLSYHVLDMTARSNTGHMPSSSTWVLLAAIAGLVSATSLLFWRKDLLRYEVRLIVIASVMLSLSLLVRGVSDSLPLVALGAFLSGAAVGLNNSALLGVALEKPLPKHRGRYLGTFSAAGALGQFCGPLIALLILHAAAWITGVKQLENYSALFLTLSVLPLGWTTLLVLQTHRRSRRKRFASQQA